MASPYLGQLLSESIADHIGATPLVQLNRLPASLGIKAIVCAKLEYFNAGGSVKDRIAKRMVEQAEKDGLIKPGDTLIEASSGNTGIAIALMAATKGYKCIITLSEKMSLEKEQILNALGAKVVRTPAGVPIESPNSILSVARRLNKEIPNSWILDQYNNPENPRAHEYGTAEEIWHQTQGKVDVILAGAGTGGTVTGLTRGLKKKSQDVFVVGVDPVGSILAHPETLNEKKSEYRVEGIGYDFVPGVLEQRTPDLWVKTTDQDSFQMARKLVREEGLLCGGSSGAVFAGLVQLLQLRPDLNVEDKTIVLVFADSLRNYLTKFADDAWMEQHGLAINAVDSGA
ncbi:tryptophan synthase beta subunit-like PLP-dependent enzyme [Aspergillus novoparasiticus]|uniref:cystathionine beta-synthase n=1 Tax=Aspergillus novoparasiticus TaxID=986946 RepID=A0A5N6F5X6_9EURO|nr:tryptophan synthase beta subunit-like PLP-dependent enzyme [Aspergillus novoparasiticus]